jgi:hypothetical protein
MAGLAEAALGVGIGIGVAIRIDIRSNGQTTESGLKSLPLDSDPEIDTDSDIDGSQIRTGDESESRPEDQIGKLVDCPHGVQLHLADRLEQGVVARRKNSLFEAHGCCLTEAHVNLADRPHFS